MGAIKADAPGVEASRPASKQLGLWSQYNMEIVIKTGIVCSECNERRARRVVAFLKDRGWNAVYGGEGRGSIVPDDEKFKQDFYEAVGRSQYA